MLRADLCDYSDAYIAVKGAITVVRPDNTKRNKSVAFRNKAPFFNCISKINNVLIDNAEDLDAVLSMYNLPEYSKNYRKEEPVCGIITGMNHVILFFLILNLLNIRHVLQEIFIILVLAMLVMIQTELVKMKPKLLFC